MTVRFTVRIPPSIAAYSKVPELRWLVAVHSTPQRMRAAARRYNGATDLDDALGLHQPAPRPWRTPNAGAIRLVRGCLNSSIVVHECVHAAAYAFRYDRQRVDLGTACRANEERFSHVVGELASQIVAGLYAAGCYDE